MNDKTMMVDVTDKVQYGLNDDEALPLTKCVCGTAFEPWDMILSVYDDTPEACPVCGRRLFFRVSIRVFEVIDGSV